MSGEQESRCHCNHLEPHPVKNEFRANVACTVLHEREECLGTSKYSLLVLNGPLPRFFREAWNKASLTICADGGSNRVLDACKASDWSPLIPDYIKGDLDSVREDTLEFFKDKGVNIIKDSDQDTNDLQKCLQLLDELSKKDAEKMTVIVLGGRGGRFDQEMANFNGIYMYPSLRVVMMTESDTVEILPPGKHVVHINPKVQGPKCGLVPLSARCDKITTTGLKWNLDDSVMHFGGLVSTSNQINASEATIENSDPIVWSVVWKRGQFVWRP